MNQTAAHLWPKTQKMAQTKTEQTNSGFEETPREPSDDARRESPSEPFSYWGWTQKNATYFLKTKIGCQV